MERYPKKINRAETIGMQINNKIHPIFFQAVSSEINTYFIVFYDKNLRFVKFNYESASKPPKLYFSDSQPAVNKLYG